jgi:phosphate transport system protein
MPASAAHTVKAFDQDLDELRASVAAVGGWAEAALREAMEGLIRMDREVAASALDRARIVRALADDVERRAVCLIALRAPRADDLREVLTCLKITGFVERIAAHAATIASTAAGFDASRAIDSPIALGNLARVALGALREALDTFVAQDPSGGASVSEAAHSAEALYGSLLQSCIAQMRRDPGSIASVTGLLFVSRSLARATDQAASIANAVHFGLTGAHAPDARREPVDLLAIGA